MSRGGFFVKINFYQTKSFPTFTIFTKQTIPAQALTANEANAALASFGADLFTLLLFVSRPQNDLHLFC